jgi:tetraacyldisaccharide 4'-kinase
MQLQGDVLINLSNAEKIPLSSFAKQTVHAVTGIGHPQRFFNYLRDAELKLVPHSFADHHDFQKSDLVFSQNYPIIMTEKDAVKCRKFQSSNCWYLPVKAQLSIGFSDALLAKLAAWHAHKDAHFHSDLESTGHSTNKRV